MSKVISFSISDKYLDKLRTLYPALTANLAVKQFVTDRLDGSLGNSLDGNLDGDLDGKLKSLIESSLSSTLDDVLDDVLDDKLKTIIETSLDDVLDERLDAVMGKLISSLSERLARLEARLDTNLDGGLDGSLDYGLPYKPSKDELTETQRRVLESRQLVKAKLEHHAYLIKHPLVVRDLSKKQPIKTDDNVETDTDTVETAINTVETDTESVETAIDTVESVTDKVESDSIDELVQPAIGPVPGDSSHLNNQLCEGMNAADAHRYLTSKGVKVSEKTLSDWISKKKHIPMTGKGDAVSEYLTLINKLYYPIN